MIKDSGGATSRTLSPPVHLQRPAAALSLQEEGSVQRCGREIRKEETHKVLTNPGHTALRG